MNSKLVVPGHSSPGSADDVSALDLIPAYLKERPAFTAEPKSSADLSRRVKVLFPGMIHVLDIFTLGDSAKVAIGE